MTISKNYTLRDLSLPAMGGLLPVPLVLSNQDVTKFTFSAGKVTFVGTGQIAKLPVPFLTSGLIATVICRLTPGGPHSQTPQFMPKLRLRGYNLSGASVVADEVTDTSAPAGSAIGGEIAAYEAAHVVTLTVTDVDAKFSATTFVVEVDCESGTGAIGGLQVDLIGCAVVPEY